MTRINKRIFSLILFSVLSASTIAPNVCATQTQEAAQQTETTQEAPKTGTTLIAVSSSNLKVGDTLKVTIRGSISSTMTLKFNPNVLKYKSSNPAGSLSENVVTYNGKETVITFEAEAAGSSGLILGGENLTGCSTIIQVDEASGEEEAATDEGDADTQDTDQGGETEGDEQAEDASKESDEPEVSTIFGTADRYISIMDPDALPTDQLESRKLETGEGTVVEAYQLAEGSNEFYYMYGMDEKENLGWFIYDSSEQTISRMDAGLFGNVTATETEDDQPEKKPSGIQIDWKGLFADRKVWAILIFAVAVIIAILVNLIIRSRSRDEEEEPEKETTSKVTTVSRSYEGHEAEAMLPEAKPEEPGGVWDEDDDEKYNLADDDEPEEEEAHVHEIIGEKRVDIMDLNDL